MALSWHGSSFQMVEAATENDLEELRWSDSIKEVGAMIALDDGKVVTNSLGNHVDMRFASCCQFDIYW